MPDLPDSAAIQRDLAFAQKLADAADRQSLPRFDAADLQISRKADDSHVTDADLATERAIRALIEAERPGDGIFGEEYGSSGTASRQWIVDPIDGTANFLRGVPLWGTLIALAIEGVPVIGVVSMPALGRRWWGARGLGAWTATDDGDKRLTASGVSSLDDAAVSFQSITQWIEAGKREELLRLAARVWRDRALGDVYSYMMLAEGRLEMVAEFGIKEYDIAAVVPIVEEAGGRFTSFDGDTTISAGSTLASNGVLHEEFLALLHAQESNAT